MILAHLLFSIPNLSIGGMAVPDFIIICWWCWWWLLSGITSRIILWNGCSAFLSCLTFFTWTVLCRYDAEVQIEFLLPHKQRKGTRPLCHIIAGNAFSYIHKVLYIGLKELGYWLRITYILACIRITFYVTWNMRRFKDAIAVYIPGVMTSYSCNPAATKPRIAYCPMGGKACVTLVHTPLFLCFSRKKCQ